MTEKVAADATEVNPMVLGGPVKWFTVAKKSSGSNVRPHFGRSRP
jgi:hypothetical protein